MKCTNCNNYVDWWLVSDNVCFVCFCKRVKQNYEANAYDDNGNPIKYG